MKGFACTGSAASPSNQIRDAAILNITVASKDFRPRVVLNRQQAREIFQLKHHHTDKFPSRHCASKALAARYHVSPKTIRDIWQGRSWLEATSDLWDQKCIPSRKIVGPRQKSIQPSEVITSKRFPDICELKDENTVFKMNQSQHRNPDVRADIGPTSFPSIENRSCELSQNLNNTKVGMSTVSNLDKLDCIMNSTVVSDNPLAALSTAETAQVGPNQLIQKIGGIEQQNVQCTPLQSVGRSLLFETNTLERKHGSIPEIQNLGYNIGVRLPWPESTLQSFPQFSFLVGPSLLQQVSFRRGPVLAGETFGGFL
jgi:hypothetical protein